MAKVKASWKQKSIYRIIAPESFDQQEIGATIASNEKNLLGRSVEVSLRDLTGDRTKQYLKLVFEIYEVDNENKKAKTKFKRFYVSSQYIRSKIREGMSKIESIAKLNLSKIPVRVKVIVATQQKIQTSKCVDINKKVIQSLKEYEKNLNIDEFLQLALFGKLGTEIYHKIKKIAPIKRVEVEEIKVI